MAIKTVIQFRKGNLSAWQTVNPTLMDGEIALVDKNNGLGEKSWMIRVGDGTTNFNGLPDLAYILDDELSASISSVIDDIRDLSSAMPEIFIDDERSSIIKFKKLSQTEYANLLVSGLVEPDCVYMVSSNVQYNYGERVADVGEAVASADALPKWQLERDFTTHEQLSSLSVNTPNLYVDGEKTTNLKFQRLSQEQYAALLISSLVDPNCLYMVSSTAQNTYGQQIKNIADATDLSDAVNLRQLKDEISTSISEISGNFLTSHQSLSDYYTKNETSSQSQISIALEGKQPTGSYLTAETEPAFSGMSSTFLTAHQSLENYYTKSNTSSDVQISTALEEVNQSIETLSIMMVGTNNLLTTLLSADLAI